jgi:hypothetical protein
LFQLHKKPFHFVGRLERERFAGRPRICRHPVVSSRRDSGRAKSNPDPDHDLSVPTWPPEKIRSRIKITSRRSNEVRRDRRPRPASSGRRALPILHCSRWDW